MKLEQKQEDTGGVSAGIWTQGILKKSMAAIIPVDKPEKSNLGENTAAEKGKSIIISQRRYKISFDCEIYTKIRWIADTNRKISLFVIASQTSKFIQNNSPLLKILRLS